MFNQSGKMTRRGKNGQLNDMTLHYVAKNCSLQKLLKLFNTMFVFLHNCGPRRG